MGSGRERLASRSGVISAEASHGARLKAVVLRGQGIILGRPPSAGSSCQPDPGSHRQSVSPHPYYTNQSLGLKTPLCPRDSAGRSNPPSRAPIRLATAHYPFDAEPSQAKESIGISGTSPTKMLFSDRLSRDRTPVLLAWVALGIAVWLVFGPFYLQALRPSPNRVTDYFQDWSSARNLVTG